MNEEKKNNVYFTLSYSSLEQNDIAEWIYTYTLRNCKINKLDFPRLFKSKYFFCLQGWYKVKC